MPEQTCRCEHNKRHHTWYNLSTDKSLLHKCAIDDCGCLRFVEKQP